MIEFLLFAILLCLCKPLRTVLGIAFWIAVILIAWHWPAAEPGASSSPAVIEQLEPVEKTLAKHPRTATAATGACAGQQFAAALQAETISGRRAIDVAQLRLLPSPAVSFRLLPCQISTKG